MWGIGGIMARYGIPYVGSKNGIAEDIIRLLPTGKYFYDLFAGGCAVTHCAIKFGKWLHYVVNDIAAGPVELFRRAVNGELSKETRVISREDFFRLKDTDPYVKYCWSFGNNGEDYLWGRDIEPIKLAACEMVMAPTVRKRRLAYKEFIRVLAENPGVVLKPKARLQGLERLEKLQGLQGLERLRGLEGLYPHNGGDVTYLNKDYQDVEIASDAAVVYCDIPYKGTLKNTKESYCVGFDHERFYEWARRVPFVVYISEYAMPDDFVCIAEFTKPVLINSGAKPTQERVFVHSRFRDCVQRQLKQGTLL